ncbi:MAG: hypothetical protein KF889_02490 [Alphaproteobacteria bacterium]|nr:hypothetical protein [Alphaproteobacteria bacterium]MCW5741778.1 hypothetical protein [Alphaproteobacteria bacterium]
MIRPGLIFALFVAQAVALLANHALGDTLIAALLGPRMALTYKTLVPLPYIGLLALIHARRTRGPQALTAGIVAGVLWASSTVLLDAAYGRLTFDESLPTLIDRYRLLEGPIWAILPLTQLLLPPVLAWRLTSGPPAAAT